MHINKQAFTSLKKKITDCLIYCILSNGEVIKYHKFISVVVIELSFRCLNTVVVIELSFRCLNTGPEDRLGEESAGWFTLSSWCLVTVIVLWLFLTLP